MDVQKDIKQQSINNRNAENTQLVSHPSFTLIKQSLDDHYFLNTNLDPSGRIAQRDLSIIQNF